MRNRIRRLGAPLALLAFSAFFAEGVWAATCPPDSDAHAPMGHAVAMGGGMMDGAADHAAHGHAHPGSDPAPHHGPPAAEPPACPVAAVTGGSCVVATLPASAAAPLRLDLSVDGALAAPAPARDLLLVAGYFRPPRA